MKGNLTGEAAYLKFGLLNSKFLSRINPNFITDEFLKTIYTKVIGYYTANHKLPSLPLLSTIVTSNGVPNKAAVLEALNLVKDVPISEHDFDSLHKQLGQVYETNVLIALNQEIAQKIEQGKIDEAKAQLVQYSMKNIKETDEFDISELVADYKPEKIFIIPTTIPEIDRHISGFGRREMIVVTAKVGDGKSLLMLHMAIQQFIAGYDVLFISLELSKEQIRSRILSSISGVKHSKIRTFQLSESDKILILQGIIRTYFKEKDHLKMFEFAQQKKLHNHIFELNKVMKILKREFEPRQNTFIIKTPVDLKLAELPLLVKKLGSIDICYLDSIDWLTPDNDNRTMWENLKKASRFIKRIAKSLNIPIVVAAQLNDEGKNTKYAKAITEDADLGLKGYRYEIPNEPPKYIIETIKTRSVEQFKEIIPVDFSHQRITTADALIGEDEFVENEQTASPEQSEKIDEYDVPKPVSDDEYKDKEEYESEVDEDEEENMEDEEDYNDE
ncbi:MAG: DnaB-like helicase C-terminal domain-containing protein [Thermoplasmata archaeon]